MKDKQYSTDILFRSIKGKPLYLDIHQ